jgi:hypothetical protein
MFIAFEQATKEEMLAAFECIGFDQIPNEAGKAFKRAEAGQTLTVAEVQAMIAQAREWGFKAIDVSRPDWIHAVTLEPFDNELTFKYLADKYEHLTFKQGEEILVPFIKNETLSPHVRFCLILIYEGNLNEEDPELENDDEYKLREIEDFLNGLND